MLGASFSGGGLDDLAAFGLARRARFLGGDPLTEAVIRARPPGRAEMMCVMPAAGL